VKLFGIDTISLTLGVVSTRAEVFYLLARLLSSETSLDPSGVILTLPGRERERGV